VNRRPGWTPRSYPRWGVLATVSLVASVVLASPAGATSTSAPRLTGLSVASGPVAGGQRVSLHGNGFTHVTRVLFGASVGHSVRVASAHALSVVVPPHKAGRVDVRVVTSAGESTIVKGDRFTYVAPPTVTSVKPATGPATGGTRVTVKGKNLLHVKAVLFGRTKGTKVHVTSATSLLVTSPAHAVGQVDIRVTTSYGASKTGKADRYGYLTPAGPIAPIPPAPAPTPVPTPVAPLIIGSTVLPSVVTGNGYPTTTLTASGGTPPYRWSATGLPNGVTLTADGTLGGSTFAVTGTRKVTLTVADTGGQTKSTTLPLIVTPHAGQLYAFGLDTHSQIGDGSTTADPAPGVTTPKLVTGLSTVVSIAGDLENGWAAKADGTVWAWGDDTEGQLGDGKTLAEASPVQVPGLSNVTAVAGGTLAAYALTSDGTVYAWGLGTGGQLGDGGGSNSSSPVQVAGATGVVSIAGTDFAAYAVRSDGTVLAWGIDEYGQLGDGGTAAQSIPITVPGLSDVVSISAGLHDIFALHGDGTVSAWGINSGGQLGLGDTVTFDQSTPVLVPQLSGITQLASAGDTSFALRSDGTIWCWGANTTDASGLGDYTAIRTPTQLPGIEGAQAIAAFEYGAFAILAGGAVKEWGENGYGELGDGSNIRRLTPLAAPWQVNTLAVGNSAQGLTNYVITRTKPVVGPINPVPPPVK
jgi:alpha-tubulin suppressor-like RCC1 family protein